MVQWNDHWRLEGKHAFLSPSNYAWQRYDEEKAKAVYINNTRKERGALEHDLASRMIKARKRAADTDQAFDLFVNHAIADRMKSEQVVYYSDICFGTADAIKYDEDTETLYISDLKTGVSKASFEQLYAYAALFCLEYGCNPDKTTFILRIYQGVGYEEEYLQGKKDVAYIKSLMKTIVKLDKAVSGVIKELQDVADGVI